MHRFAHCLLFPNEIIYGELWSYIYGNSSVTKHFRKRSGHHADEKTGAEGLVWKLAQPAWKWICVSTYWVPAVSLLGLVIFLTKALQTMTNNNMCKSPHLWYCQGSMQKYLLLTFKFSLSLCIFSMDGDTVSENVMTCDMQDSYVSRQYGNVPCRRRCNILLGF